MDPHFYIINGIIEEHHKYSVKNFKPEISHHQISDYVHHISKSPTYHIDIYEDYIVDKFGSPLKVESWIRGQPCVETDKVCHIKTMIGYNNIQYTETHDHSKICLSTDPKNPYIGICDLNRMLSQRTRSGSAIIVVDYKIWKTLNELVYN